MVCLLIYMVEIVLRFMARDSTAAFFHDDWTQMRYELAQAGHPLGAFTAFQVSWIVVATFLLVNLIVGAVINNDQNVQDIEEHRSLAPDTSERRVRELVRELDAILNSRSQQLAASNAGSSPDADRSV